MQSTGSIIRRGLSALSVVVAAHHLLLAVPEADLSGDLWIPFRILQWSPTVFFLSLAHLLRAGWDVTDADDVERAGFQLFLMFCTSVLYLAVSVMTTPLRWAMHWPVMLLLCGFAPGLTTLMCFCIGRELYLGVAGG
jgi:hypothetical protein